MAMYSPILKALQIKGKPRLISQQLTLTRSKSPKLSRAASCASSGVIPSVNVGLRPHLNMEAQL